MASLDFIIDLIEKIESQKIDYYLITSQKSKGGFRCDIFYKFEENESAQAIVKINEKIINDIKAKYGVENENKKGEKKKGEKKKGEKGKGGKDKK